MGNRPVLLVKSDGFMARKVAITGELKTDYNEKY